VLEAVVLTYIEQGEPVSSLWLAERGGLGVSSATVRSTLSHLEEIGLIHQPHTSAGACRPTVGTGLCEPADRGSAAASSRRGRRGAPAPRGTVEDVLQDASRELSRASHHVGFALAAEDEETAFQHIDFVPLDGSRVLVVVIATGGRISHKVVGVDEPCVRPICSRPRINLNTAFAGLPLGDVREAILARLREERTLYDVLAARASARAIGFEDSCPTACSSCRARRLCSIASRAAP